MALSSPQIGVQLIEIASDEAELRLDRWFKRHYPALPHGMLEKYLRTGQVRLDGKRVAANTRLASGQTLRVPPLPAIVQGNDKSNSLLDPRDAAFIQRLVIYQDDAVIAVNKPAGLAVQGGSGTKRHLDGMLDGLRFGHSERPRLVHRLDRDTSGVLLLARSAASAAFLARGFKQRSSRKLYWALVAGVPKLPAGVIDLALAKKGAYGRERVAASDQNAAKHALTHYKMIENAGDRASWLALQPVTGRTHQLRVHCVALGVPILGDGKYGGKAALLPGSAISRSLHLHARRLIMRHPNGTMLDITAPLPPMLVTSWRYFNFSPEMAGGSELFAA